MEKRQQQQQARRQKDFATPQLQTTDIDERLTALKRMNAAQLRSKDRPERPLKPSSSSSKLLPSPPPPPPSAPRKHIPPSQEADHEEFSRLKITASPAPRSPLPSKRSHTTKLFDPESDPIPPRHHDLEPHSDATSSSYIHRTSPSNPPISASHPHRESNSSHPRLYDPRKDDPVRFSVHSRPQTSRMLIATKQNIAAMNLDTASSSASSYATSVSGSSFSLSSATESSSNPSALFDEKKRPKDESATNAFAEKLKKLYRTITSLESKIKAEDTAETVDSGRILYKGEPLENDELEKEKWKKRLTDHKLLAEVTHNLLEISLAPSVPASLRNIPTKYNIIVRLWTYAFHKLLESLRRASLNSPLAMEHLQDFIYYAYSFYTGLLEDRSLENFKHGWLEALGDLARYRMAVTAMVTGSPTSGPHFSDTEPIAQFSSTETLTPHVLGGTKSVSDRPAARIDDSPSPSVGIAAARMMDVEPEKERWRTIAKDWYSAGLADQPGTGKLHHHLGLLFREADREDLRGVYHFVKSMTTRNPFPTSRESVLPMWSQQAQAKRALPDAPVHDLFVMLHGMLFTNIQLDDFQPTLARLIERLEIDGAEEQEWIMMGIINIASICEYGKSSSVIKRSSGTTNSGVGASGAKMIAKHQIPAIDVAMDVDEDPSQPRPQIVNVVVTSGDGTQISPPPSEMGHELAHPMSFTCALQLAFAMLKLLLRNPNRDGISVNPYLTIILTFLSLEVDNPTVLAALERSIPWGELCEFLSTAPPKVLNSQRPNPSDERSRWDTVSTRVSPPLPEDWCMRGMDWQSRGVFDRGYFNRPDEDESRKMEMEVLETKREPYQNMAEGIIVDDSNVEKRVLHPKQKGGQKIKSVDQPTRRWVRLVRCGLLISTRVPGFGISDQTNQWEIEGQLAAKVKLWREQEEYEKRQEEERRRRSSRWDDSMDVDVDEAVEDGSSEDSEDDEYDSPEIKALKARRRYLKSLINPSSPPNNSSLRPHTSRNRPSKKASAPPLPIVPGYTVLVVDTNILLSSLFPLSLVIESMRWTVVIPLPVIMELDGLATSTSPQLAEAAKSAITYLDSHITTHGTSLKVQTSKGNYLRNLSIRQESVEFHGSLGGTIDRNMDDLILKAAIWQDEHWVDRSAYLGNHDQSVVTLPNAIKVVLLSLDRNLRLKARSRQLAAASEMDLASILTTQG